MEVLVLGTVQDGGVPHLGCRCERCAALRSGLLPARSVACIAVIDRPAGAAWLVDATPDIRGEVARLLEAPGLEGRPAREPVSGILLTHAHIGHYLGLAFLGRESIHARGMPVYCSARMASFLRRNAPFELLVRLGNVDLRPVEAGRPFRLGPRVSVIPRAVPHRQEYTDTYAYRIEGPERSLFYVSDVDRWDEATVAQVREADVALLDGTFYSMGELPGRPRSEIPHPPMRETMERFAGPARSRRLLFTHLNHSNPVLDPSSPEAREVRRAGFEVACEGMRIAL